MIDQFKLARVDPVDTANGGQVDVTGMPLQQFQQCRQGLGVDVDTNTA